MTIGTVPTFYLYGEPHRAVEDGFVHAEAIDDRSRPSAWTIRPHTHMRLAHIFFLATGGATVRVNDETHRCTAPCLMLVPATVIHGFDWIEETSGAVVTVAARRLAALAALAPEIADLLARFEVIPLAANDAARVETCAADLMRELGWSKIGHDAAIQSLLLALLVTALRLREAPPTRDDTRQRLLVARLRARIEARFRLREPVSAYASALGASETALRAACASVAGSSPAAMIDERALLEARRALIFSDQPIGQLALALGFEDPAYFSRFFTRHIGRSPRTYRAEQHKG
ncbi:helix-turn-helix domain-containing protein [Sphingomonas nostoxanthinifaciens]|uniref:helix-turn-helix domain-containing protein n=1 Tax=Sphingomonas nostoxanthinifaciens TaxID=2872652 RepID=UPI001CC1F964|nr:helix-turn-helix domain-containing protein [Sphingomonas nostoxanthinifaciens]UAK23238.1 helix-turn-helix domain-containing protein [Sphingomonas nostoxanthinifaciens]